MRRLFLPLLLASFILSSHAEGLLDRAKQLPRSKLESPLRFLADDALEGRAPGTRGGNLAELYLESCFRELGLAPGANGSYFQPFDMIGFQTIDLDVSAGKERLVNQEDVIGSCTLQQESFELEGDAIFIGFGINAPGFSWDDFKGTDLKGKILVVRANDPGLYDSSLFDGKTMSFFGRWSYKVEEAVRQGAKAVLIIHTNETAAYSWDVVKHSWAGEAVYLPSVLDESTIFRGWISEAAFRRTLTSSGLNLDDLYRKSLDPSFRPIPLPIKVHIAGHQRQRRFQARNVVAEWPGKSKESIVFCAHIDHLGIQPGTGDNIFNGAIDNGTAVSTLLAVARTIAEEGRPLRHTIRFLACQAEEAGLLGSRYFVEHSAGAPTVACINFESTPPWERTTDFAASGARFSSLEEPIRKLVESQGLKYSVSPLEQQGFFYRSDQFPFARHGIPAVWLTPGSGYPTGRDPIGDYLRKVYHTPKDEFDPSWTLDGMRQTLEMAIRLLDYLEQAPPPTLNAKVPFPVVPIH